MSHHEEMAMSLSTSHCEHCEHEKKSTGEPVKDSPCNGHCLSQPTSVNFSSIETSSTLAAAAFPANFYVVLPPLKPKELTRYHAPPGVVSWNQALILRC